MPNLYIRRALLSPIEGVTVPYSPGLSQAPNARHRLEDCDGEIVLVEAKAYDKELVRGEFGKKIFERVEEIAYMLHETSSDNDIPVLECKGYSEDPGASEYLFVFRLPPEASQIPVMPISLLEHIRQPALWSLTARIRLAQRLATALYEIHCKGWLHKGIRTDNVLFFPSAPGARRNIEMPRLVGFDFARKDGPSELEPTEKIAAIDIEPNLYRHPDALHDPTTRFTRRHEYYSFGVLLLEIAKWHSIRYILKSHFALEAKHYQDEDLKKVKDILLDPNSRENHMADIAFRTGEVYRGVVETCLKGEFGVGGTGDELLEMFKKKVVEQLARCTI